MRFVLLSVVLPAVALAAPIELTHQGRLLDAAGTPVNRTVALDVRLFGSATGTDLLFDDDFAAVSVEGGYYQVVLGQDPADPLDSAVLANPTGVFVEVAVDGVATGPRQPLVGVPRAAVATDVDGGTVTASSVTLTGAGEIVLGQTTASTCTTEGALVYDPDLRLLKVCVGTQFLAIGLREIVDGPSGRTWSDGSVAPSCEAYRRPTDPNKAYSGAIGDGQYVIDPDGAGGAAPWTAWCDMTTDGGGWTIVHAISGSDGEQALVSDVEAGGNPLTFAHYNVDRAKKMALSALAAETLFLRSDGRWIKASAPLFDGNLATPNQHPHATVTLTARSGATATATMGYANFNNAGGGDFGIRNSAFDHHSTYYYHLQSGCTAHYLYSYSAAVGDADAGYDVSLGLGDWPTTRTCDSAEGGGLVFRTALR